MSRVLHGEAAPLKSDAEFKGIVRAGVLALLLATHVQALTLRIEIEPVWQDQPVVLEESWHERGSGAVCFTRLAGLLSEPVLTAADGTRLASSETFGLLDASEPAPALMLHNLPAMRVSELAFTLGLPEPVDRADPNQWPPAHPLHPIRNNLHWSWQGGYIYLAMEGHWKEGKKEGGFSHHLGNAPHLMRVRIPLDLPLQSDTTLRLRFRLDRVLGDSAAVSLAEQNSTHGRVGDALAMTLKQRVEAAFEAGKTTRPATPAAGAMPRGADFTGTPYRFTTKRHFPMPALPADYPLTDERVELGRRLFQDTLLSGDGTLSCAACHRADAALSDPRPLSTGIGGQSTARHSMPLTNLAWKSRFFWDGRAPTLRAQILMPVQDPAEMGESLENLEAKLAAHPAYPSLFRAAFGTRETTAERLSIAIEQFLLTQTSLDSRFDQAMLGKAELTDQEKRGFELFFTEYEPRQGLRGADCFHCHGGAFFTDHGFHNNGLDSGADTGLAKTTGRESDTGKFATPSLRNIALTAPYMHDGRFQTLEEVIAHYTTGIRRSPALDPNLAKHPAPGIPLSADDQAALVAFLKTLSDPKFGKALAPLE